MADAYAITMYRGDSYPIAVTVTDKATGEPLDITGATAKMTVNSVKEPATEDTQLFEVDAVLATDPTTGVMSFTPTATDTATVGSFFYDIQLTMGSTIRTIIKSTFAVTMDITK